MIAFADQDLVVVPGQRLAFRSVAPADKGAARAARSERKVLEPHDLLDHGAGINPPGTGKTHLAIAIGIRACLAGQRVVFRTATEWVALLADAQRQGRLDDELTRLQRVPLLVVDEVGYIPFDPQAAT